tara:strand:+ start:734 stop:982 length:249 start_codon:yes stop_codon:yes gene_type:complete
MKVKVLLFSILRDLTGEETLELEVRKDGPLVCDVLEMVFERHPVIREWDSKLLIALNGEFADRNQKVSGEDELALMPPVQGG